LSREPPKNQALGCLSVIVIIIIAVIVCTIPDTSPSSTDSGPAIKITAVQLFAEYDANEIAADQKYEDKTLEVSGVILRIGKDILDDPFVTLAGNSVWGVQCMFTNDNQVVNLSPGQSITVRGTCDGSLVNVILRRCTVVD